MLVYDNNKKKRVRAKKDGIINLNHIQFRVVSGFVLRERASAPSCFHFPEAHSRGEHNGATSCFSHILWNFSLSSCVEDTWLRSCSPRSQPSASLALPLALLSNERILIKFNLLWFNSDLFHMRQLPSLSVWQIYAPESWETSIGCGN